MLTCRSILYAPFVPFIVIFCHIIEVSDRDDLSRLEDFVSSLQPICPLSEAIDKLYRLCQVLSAVARLYVEAKTQNQQDQSLVSVGQEFDTYLSALGLAPAMADGGERWSASAPMMGESNVVDNQTMQLGNWFSGNQYMMGLLEEDLDLLTGLPYTTG